MSSRQYTVTVKLKGDDTFRKLEKLEGGNGGGGGGGKSTSAAASGGGVFQKIQSNTLMQVAQLAGIAGGIAGLTAIMTKASGHLQATFKLWETGMMLIFRPIGDFIGLVFRPMALMMLAWAMPFYKETLQWVREWGPKIGAALAGGEPLANPVFGLDLPNRADYDKFFTGIGESIEKFKTELGISLLGLPSQIAQSFIDFKDSVWNSLVSIPSTIAQVFTDFGANLWNNLTVFPSFLGKLFMGFAQNVWNSILGIPGMIVDVFTGLATSLVAALASIPQQIRQSIEAAIWAQTGVIGSPPSLAGRFDNTSAASGSRGRTNTAAIADTLG